MQILEALKNALEFMEACGYKNGGDIHDDLQCAIYHIQTKHPKIGKEEILTNYELSPPTKYLGKKKEKIVPIKNQTEGWIEVIKNTGKDIRNE